jgi:Uma2 family endonuclease
MEPKAINGDQWLRIAEITPKTELWRGQPTPRMAAIADYCALVGRVAGYLGGHVLPRGLGEIFASECAFFPAGDEGVLLVPDVAFVRAERLPPLTERPAALQLAPDLAIGIAEAPLWPPHAAEHLDDYLASGVALVWIVDPIAGRVTVHAPGSGERTLGPDDVLDGGAVLPEFRLPVSALFR